MEYKVMVKPWMTNYNTFMDGNSFLMKYNKCPMPFCTMYGKKLQETPTMIRMELYADIREEYTENCIKCGKPLTNEVSKYLGIGPECGHHNYTLPFEDEQKLNEARKEIKENLKQIKWEGWILKSGIVNLNDIIGNEIIEKEEKPVKISINVDKPTKCNGKYSLYITFPYNAAILDIIREQPIRYWLPNSKEWELPFKCLSKLKEDLKEFDIEINDPNNIIKQQEKESKKVYNIPKNYKFKTEPFNHQIEGIQYGLKYDRFLLGDEQGLGKTKQIIDLACIKKSQKGYKYCLIICGVNGLKWNWKAEVKKHSNENAYILGTRRNKKEKEYIGSMQDRLEDLDYLLKLHTSKNTPSINYCFADNYFLITNIETLRNEQIIEKLKVLCNEGIINMLALDERS